MPLWLPDPQHPRPSCSSACPHVVLRGSDLPRAAPRIFIVFTGGPRWPGSVRCHCWRRVVAPVALFKSFDQLPQRAAIRNIVQAVASQIHLLAKSRETRLPDYVRLLCASRSTPRRVSSSFADRALSTAAFEISLRILRRGDRLRHRSCQAKSHLFTERLHSCLESWRIDWRHTIVPACAHSCLHGHFHSGLP